MSKTPSRPRDPNQLAKQIVDIATGATPDNQPDDGKLPAAVELGRRGGLKGGKARAASLTDEQRSEIARKEELAHMADSLVALTSLRRRVSREMETVGGPVDVALISKGDGFVWIKRKHYFRPDINPQFVRNYMDDVRRSEPS